MPIGLILERWRELDEAKGPLGCPTGPEFAVEGTNARKTTFKNGEIVWSPSQGPKMLVAAYQEDDNIIVNWGDTTPHSYEFFIVGWDKDGLRGQADVDSYVEPMRGFYRIKPLLPGRYSISVEGCNKGVLGADCPQEWTVAVNVTYALPPIPDYPDCWPVKNPSARIRVTGPIGERWAQLQGAEGPLGCPVGPAQPVPGRAGATQMFKHGTIVFSPEQGEMMTLVLYQTDGKLIAEWGPTIPFRYNKFILIFTKDGQQITQQDVPGSPNAGQWSTPVTSPGAYSVGVEGCHTSTLGRSDCPQKWTIPAILPVTEIVGPSKPFQFRVANLAALPTPRTVEDALRDKPMRARLAAEEVAHNFSLVGNWGDDQVTAAIAMLYLVADGATTPKGPRRRFQRFGMLTEVNNAIREQKIYAKSGTTLPVEPCGKRTGDYDMALKGYITILYRYGHLLSPDVRYRILHLLNKIGRHTEDDDTIQCQAAALFIPIFGTFVKIPESENHKWMIESSRYLTNQILLKRNRDEQFNNATNGMDELILGRLQEHLKWDFVEYNSRPYARLTWAAIQNLADFAENPAVKQTAKAVLDYLAAKTAVSSSDGRRNPPYRRKAAHNHPELFHAEADRLKKRFLLYTAPTLVMNELRPEKSLEPFSAPEMVLAAATSYQPPPLVIDLMVNPAARRFYQRFDHHTTEIYAAEPDFLISAGGVATGYAYTVAGQGKDDDRGILQATVLMPIGQFTDIRQMIRFEGWPGTCVAPGFACGMQPIIPPEYTKKPACVRRNGRWTFIDFASDACRDAEHREFGFYAAVFGADGPIAGGSFEAVPKSKVKDVSLDEFARITLERNGRRTYSLSEENRYVAWGQNEIRFKLRSPDSILSTGLPDIDKLLADSSSTLARGTIINSQGRSGVITITNPSRKESLVLRSAALPAAPPAPTRAPAPVPPTPTASARPRDTLAALGARGVDFSVAEAAMRGWITNSYTAYPAISAALLRLLQDRPLRRPVYLDVIVFNYENAPGATSPRALADVDMARLKAAIVEGYDSRYGEHVSDFQQVLR